MAIRTTRKKMKKIAPATRTLDLGLVESYLGYSLRRAQIAIFDEFIRCFAKLELRPAQFSVLLVIGKNPGRNQSEVAASLGIQRANFVALINLLQKRRLVERRPMNRRSYALHLTGQGEDLLASALHEQDRLEARIETRLGDDGKARLMDLLARLY